MRSTESSHTSSPSPRAPLGTTHRPARRWSTTTTPSAAAGSSSRQTTVTRSMRAQSTSPGWTTNLKGSLSRSTMTVPLCAAQSTRMPRPAQRTNPPALPDSAHALRPPQSLAGRRRGRRDGDRGVRGDRARQPPRVDRSSGRLAHRVAVPPRRRPRPGRDGVRAHLADLAPSGVAGLDLDAGDRDGGPRCQQCGYRDRLRHRRRDRARGTPGRMARGPLLAYLALAVAPLDALTSPGRADKPTLADGPPGPRPAYPDHDPGVHAYGGH